MVAESLHLAKQLVKELVHPLVWPVQELRGVVAGAPMLALLLLIALLTCAVRAIRGHRLAALALLPLSLAWAVFNGPFEGPTLFVISWSHGITASDFISLAGLTIAAWRLLPVLAGR